jgi:magnesium transporter
MTHIIQGLGPAEREEIAVLRKSERFFWIDLSVGESRDGLGEALGVPEPALRALFDFGESVAAVRKFHADGRQVVFALSCYLESSSPAGGSPYRLHPVEVHVLVTGDYVLTMHEDRVSLPRLLAPDMPEGRSDQYVVYTVVDSMVTTAFDALDEAELALERLGLTSADVRMGRAPMAALRAINSRLSGMRRLVGPQRGLAERVSVEIGRVEGLEADDEPYFERIVGQLNRLVDGIDAAADALSKGISLRLNETTYWLTVVATIFLPLTFITGFFGMNFGWMVEQIDTALAFWLLGGGSLLVGVALIWRLVVRGSPAQAEQDRAEGAQ